MDNVNDFLWTEKYRPSTVDDCILPDKLKDTFSFFVKEKQIPNLLLTGSSGVGKTTVAKAMLDELDCSSIIINGSMKGNIDTLRVEINNFASSISFDGKRKYVILDEADYLNAQSTQPALRNFMEEFSKNCGFILTCNYVNRIIEPLQSRCSVIDFQIPGKDKPKLASAFMKRAQTVLDNENVEYDKKIVAEVVKTFFPDWRRVLNELQRYSANGKIDSGILTSFNDKNFEELIKHLKDKKFTDMRKWVAKNVDIDPMVIMRKLYDQSYDIIKPQSIPQLVLTLADYQYKHSFVADREINLVACLAEVMVECEWNG